jgi:hypothetical protein
MFSPSREIEQEAVFNMLGKGTKEDPIIIDTPNNTYMPMQFTPQAPIRNNINFNYDTDEEETVIETPDIDINRIVDSIGSRNLSPDQVADLLVHQGSDERLNQINDVVHNAMILMDSVIELRRNIEEENSIARRIMFELIHHDTNTTTEEEKENTN